MENSEKDVIKSDRDSELKSRDGKFIINHEYSRICEERPRSVTMYQYSVIRLERLRKTTKCLGQEK
jgi:hypothetical protein